MKKKLKLTNLRDHSISKNSLKNIYAGSEACGNTCDCTCQCDANDAQQLNSNVSTVSTNNRDHSFVSNFVDALINWEPHHV